MFHVLTVTMNAKETTTLANNALTQYMCAWTLCMFACFQGGALIFIQQLQSDTINSVCNGQTQ